MIVISKSQDSFIANAQEAEAGRILWVEGHPS